MNYEVTPLSEQKNTLKYFILQGNCFEYPLNKPNYFALHYAFKNNFIISSSLPKQDIEIVEGSLFLAKTADKYILKNCEVHNSSVFSILIDNQYFNTDFITNSKISENLQAFMTNSKLGFVILKCKYYTDISNKLLDETNLSLLNSGNISQNRLTKLVKEILINVDASYQCETISSTPLIEDILEYIRTNSATVNLKILSQKYNYSVSYISELIHKETGLTFSQTLKAIRMAKSIELLKTTDKTVNEIGEVIGYNSTPGFIVAFHDMYNMTPTEYRRNSTELN